MSLYNQEAVDSAVKERLQSEGKIYLTCDEHKWTYGSKKPWNFKCPQCTKAAFLGLYMALPPSHRDEFLEAFEENIHHMIESANRGELQKQVFLNRPEVIVEKE